MIKNLFLFFAALGLFATLSKAQVSSVTGQYLQDNNILLNPGFESGIGKWVNSAGTFTADYTNFVQGKASGKIVLSAQALAFTQDSTSFVTALADGVQGLVSVYIKSEFPAKVCSRSAGSTITTNCVDVVGNNKWSLYKVPSILGATSNGISVNTNGTNVTGTIYIDESFVGIQDLKQDTSTCNSIECETEFSANISITGVVSAENYDFINGNCAVTSTNQYTCTLTTSAFSQPLNCSPVVQTNVVITSNANMQSSSSSSFVYQTYQNADSVARAQPVSIICQRSGTDFTNAKRLGNNQIYSSTNADTDWASCGLTGSAFTGFGSSVPTPALQCKRQGSDLLIKGTFQAGTTPTAVEARMSLPTWNGVQLTSASSAIIPALQLVGNVTANVNSTTFFGNYSLIEPSVTYVTFSQQASTLNGYTKALGNQIASTGTQYSIIARVPINGWNNSNIIIGQFKEVVTTPNENKPIIYSGLFSNAVGSVVPCSSGTCAMTGTFTGGAVGSFVSTGKYTLTFAANSFRASSLVACHFKCNETLTTNSNFDGSAPAISAVNGGFVFNNIGCVTTASTPARTNSSVSWTCTGVK